MIKRMYRWMARVGGGTLVARAWQYSQRTVLDSAIRLGSRTALDTALNTAADIIPITDTHTYMQVFSVTKPLTVYVRASHCRVTICRKASDRVILQAQMYRSFGLEFATEQDDVGVYIVAKRKPVVGTLSRAEFTLTVPFESHLVFNLTPGEVLLLDVDGLVELPTGDLPVSPNN
jgi:hypothetical protein